jgi:glyoxylase-like metal-dependent hydrolase (beta-lactamase superfamily II)
MLRKWPEEVRARRSGLTHIVKTVVALLLSGAAVWAQNAPPQGVPENAVTRVSEHVYAIVGYPNIAIVTGRHATLVVDTGMGPRNGAVVVREAQKLAHNTLLYLTTTHFHPEHAMGEQAFPPNTLLIRPAAQQEEMEKRGAEYIERFSKQSAENKELLKDVKLRKPDIVFDKEAKLDLGGVTARLLWLGPAHTLGDELIFVEGDKTLISGDIVQSKLIPFIPNSDSSVTNWLAILDKLALLNPRFVVPDHGPLGDGSLIAQQKAFLAAFHKRALELSRQGTRVDQAAQILTAELKAKYPDWLTLDSVPNLVRRIYEEGE